MEEVKELMNTVSEIMYKSFIKYIMLLAITAMIICFVSSENSEPYVSDNIYHFMKILTDPCTKELRGGSGISSAINKLSNASDTVKNVGNTINQITSNVKHDVDHEKYLKNTLESITNKYCSDANNINEIGVLGSFTYVVQSSWLACYNAIQWVNAGIVACIGLKLNWMVFKPYHYVGIFIIFFLFIMLNKASTKFVETILGRILNRSSKTYVNTIFYTFISSFLSVLFLYFMVAMVAYFTFLPYGFSNIKSDQSSTSLQFMYLFLGSTLLFLVGLDITSPFRDKAAPPTTSVSNLDGLKSERPNPEPKKPCNKTSSILSKSLFIFIIPLTAAIYCVAQLIYRGITGVGSAMRTTDMNDSNKLKMVFGYFVFFALLYTLLPIFLYITVPSIIKSFRKKDFLPLYYSKVKKFAL